MEMNRKMFIALVLVTGQTLVQMNLAKIEAQSNLQLLAEVAATLKPTKIQASSWDQMQEDQKQSNSDSK
ncbi:hypothetical protein CHUAL_010783 [Chamberlinius hualienensis]